MNVLILNGSLRNNGNTNRACVILKEVLKERKHSYTEVNEYVSDCLNCGMCKRSHKCCMNDSMSVDFTEYDSVVLLSPMYFFNISGKARLMLDRLYCNSNKNLILTAITTSGSESFEDSGVDLFCENLKRISSYCGYFCIEPLNFVTADTLIDYLEEDRDLFRALVKIMEGVYCEIKKDS